MCPRPVTHVDSNFIFSDRTENSRGRLSRCRLSDGGVGGGGYAPMQSYVPVPRDSATPAMLSDVGGGGGDIQELCDTASVSMVRAAAYATTRVERGGDGDDTPVLRVGGSPRSSEPRPLLPESMHSSHPESSTSPDGASWASAASWHDLRGRDATSWNDIYTGPSNPHPTLARGHHMVVLLTPPRSVSSPSYSGQNATVLLSPLWYHAREVPLSRRGSRRIATT